jgi:hypothetical protein
MPHPAAAAFFLLGTSTSNFERDGNFILVMIKNKWVLKKLYDERCAIISPFPAAFRQIGN